MTISIRGAIAATLLAGSALAAAPAFADEAPASPVTITGNVSLVTDYRFRGISQSAGKMAVQGGITATHSSGFYVGTWSSSISEGSLPGYGSQELDLFAGWSGEVTPGVTLDAGLLYYVYPGGTDAFDTDFFEPWASIKGTVGPATIKVGANYAWKQSSLPNAFDGSKDDNLYVYGNVDIAIPSTPVTVSGHIGYTNGVLAPCYYCTGDKTGVDYSIGASATVFGPLSVGVSYIGVSGPSFNNYSDDLGRRHRHGFVLIV
ncbi:TorF family putative porin [Novosphingobium colocasiae]